MVTVLQAKIMRATSVKDVRELLIKSYENFEIEDDTYQELSYISDNVGVAVDILSTLMDVDEVQIKDEIEKQLNDSSNIDRYSVFNLTNRIAKICKEDNDSMALLKELIKIYLISIYMCDSMLGED